MRASQVPMGTVQRDGLFCWRSVCSMSMRQQDPSLPGLPGILCKGREQRRRRRGSQRTRARDASGRAAGRLTDWLALLWASATAPSPTGTHLLCCMSDCLSDNLSDCDPGTLLAATPLAMQHGGRPTLRPGPVLIFPVELHSWRGRCFFSCLCRFFCSLLSAVCSSSRNSIGAALTSHPPPITTIWNKQQRAFDGLAGYGSKVD